ncbi:MAG: hypothetical protein GTN74_03725 [Proteobacteria bacterium]|nr:hypothetical protein [Pseudomonadota bacterium]NIS68399.1 hypothetical protein [Pseudomonadota bacterium]
MIKLERSITINAPLENVFAYVEDPELDLEWLPGLMEVWDVKGRGVETHYRWAYKMAGLRLEGEGAITEYIRNQRIVAQTKGGVVSNWTWNFEPHEGGTKVNLSMEYTVPVPVLGKLAEALILKQNERELDLAMTNIKARIEG